MWFWYVDVCDGSECFKVFPEVFVGHGLGDVGDENLAAGGLLVHFQLLGLRNFHVAPSGII